MIKKTKRWLSASYATNYNKQTKIYKKNKCLFIYTSYKHTILPTMEYIK